MFRGGNIITHKVMPQRKPQRLKLNIRWGFIKNISLVAVGLTIGLSAILISHYSVDINKSTKILHTPLKKSNYALVYSIRKYARNNGECVYLKMISNTSYNFDAIQQEVDAQVNASNNADTSDINTQIAENDLTLKKINNIELDFAKKQSHSLKESSKVIGIIESQKHSMKADIIMKIASSSDQELSEQLADINNDIKSVQNEGNAIFAHLHNKINELNNKLSSAGNHIVVSNIYNEIQDRTLKLNSLKASKAQTIDDLAFFRDVIKEQQLTRSKVKILSDSIKNSNSSLNSMKNQ